MATTIEHAFHDAAYDVYHNEAYERVHISCPCPPRLAQWIAPHGKTAWLITADNPGTARLGEHVNTARRHMLGTWVRTRGFACRPCVNRDLSGDWPDEHGLVILGIEEGRARALGQRFGQWAMVAIGPERPVELIWLRAQASE